MKRLTDMPPQLATRVHHGSVPVKCDCGEIFAPEIDRGNPVTCPRCGASEDVDLSSNAMLRASILAAQKM